jgi:hypothetical protein
VDLRELLAIDLEVFSVTIARALQKSSSDLSRHPTLRSPPSAYEISLLDRLLEVSTAIDEPDDDNESDGSASDPRLTIGHSVSASHAC